MPWYGAQFIPQLLDISQCTTVWSRYSGPPRGAVSAALQTFFRDRNWHGGEL